MPLQSDDYASFNKIANQYNKINSNDSKMTALLTAVIILQVPHVNISMKLLEDPSFNPGSEIYLESLGIIGSVPAAWLIVTLIVLLIYLLTRCCDTKVIRFQEIFFFVAHKKSYE